VGGRKEVIVTKVRSLLKPKPLDEIRDPRFKFDSISEAHAACGIKIAAPNLGDALAGSPLRVIGKDVEKGVAEVKAEIAEIKVETEKAGVVVKADTLGSLEALINMLEKEGIPVRMADVGDVSRRDVIEAETVKKEAGNRAVVMGFNVKVLKDAEERARATATPIFQNNVIYRLIEDYQKWIIEEEERKKREELDKLTKPAKIKILPDYVFRVSKPAIVGIEVLAGTIRTNVRLMNDEGRTIGTVKGLQDRNENIEEARKGRQVAIAIDGPIVGRQINENDILYSELQENEVKLIEAKYRKNLSTDEEEAFEEIKKIKR